jgi:hypothetical protein
VIEQWEALLFEMEEMVEWLNVVMVEWGVLKE